MLEGFNPSQGTNLNFSYLLLEKVEKLRLAFNEVKKHVAEMLVRREVARGSNPEALRNLGKCWLSLSRDMQIKWIDEVWLDFIHDWII